MRRHRIVSEHEQREWLARNIRVRRSELDLTIHEASKLAGMNPRQWQKVEGNETNATLATMSKFCIALGVDIVQLLSEPRSTGAP
jgi:transcriptional regulator with XRE-family HTH domain